jgi:putative copper export protein
VSASDVIAVAARAIAFAGIVVLAGAMAFYFGVLRRHAGAAAHSAQSATIGAFAALCVLLVAPVRLYEQARAFVDAPDPVTPMIANVLGTLWGRGLMVQALAACAALAGLLLARRGVRAGWWLSLIAIASLCATPAFMGHAAAAEQYLVLSIVADWVHVSAAGAWVGSLLLLTLAVRRLAAAGASGDSAASLIELFHPIALASTGVLLASGVVSLWLRMEHLTDLLRSEYGVWFGIKIVLTIVVASIGFFHSRSGARFARRDGPRAIVRTLTIEVVVAVAVIAATAVLVGTSPPMSGMDMSSAAPERTTMHR